MKKSTLNIRIQDPSGQVRLIPLRGEAEVPFKDPSVGLRKLKLVPRQFMQQTSYWLCASESDLPLRVGDFWVKEAELPPGVPVRFGESRFSLETPDSEQAIPAYPSGVRPWLTQSERGREVLWLTKKGALTSLSVYLAGETGTGKEVLAHLIHAWSPRAAGNFVPIHCGAIAQTLVESELFGHVKGAFTGAHLSRPGALMQAHGGTLFLDEVAELPLDTQVKLLRFLEDGEIRPVGSDRISHANVRLICATHQPLQRLVEEGKFRRDLYYRLASLTIEIPPLRERTEDIEFLSKKYAAEVEKCLSPRALLRLKAHFWPGNVRELRHSVDRAAGIAGPFRNTLDEQDFSFLLKTGFKLDSANLAASELGNSAVTLAEMERHMIMKALRLTEGNRREASVLLGIARSTLFEMLKRYKIPQVRSGALTPPSASRRKCSELSPSESMH